MTRQGQTPAAERPVLSVQELAQRWRVDVKTIYQAIELGQIPVIRVGKRVIRIPTAAIERMEQGRAVPVKEA